MKNLLRLQNLKRFYNILKKLEQKTGTRKLSQCDGTMNWPERGVYFFMEDGEERRESGQGQRIVRVGSHAVTVTSKTTLWDRLKAHKGPNFKRSDSASEGTVFRCLIGTSFIMKKYNIRCYSWWLPSCIFCNQASNQPEDDKETGLDIEKFVSDYIRKMPFLWLEVDDENDRNKGVELRKYIEENSIALLSNYEKPEIIDAPSEKWLGNYYPDRIGLDRVKKSGLWNQDEVNENYDPEFLYKLETLVNQMRM